MFFFVWLLFCFSLAFVDTILCILIQIAGFFFFWFFFFVFLFVLFFSNAMVCIRLLSLLSLACVLLFRARSFGTIPE